MHKERFGMKEEYEKFLKCEDIEGRIKSLMYLAFEEGYVKGFEAAN